ncbi:MAG: CDP-glycerol glycerophosphotransferase family protein [Abditibacteriales bacterium]|nr:CDP-glycerol glycerophosphotransferase family protein [Abditibacteriales bacterium]MDW8364261.1 CDP-glycerol glycerophosphotransferase family protein [Abditibacteriales bacterium]
MTVAYYTQHLRDLYWVKPIWEVTGGIFCSELAETGRLMQQHEPALPFRHIPTGIKLTLGRAAGEGSVRVKRKSVRLQLAQVARALKPDVIVTTSNHRHAIRRDFWGWLRQGFTTFPQVKQVQAFHGVSSKNVKFNPWMAEYDLLLLPGYRERDKFAELGILRHVRHALIGHPKADRVLRGELTREVARARLGLPDRPTVLYAPTHGALSSFYRWGLAVCGAVPDGCNLIVKPHPSLVTTIAAEGTGGAMLTAVTDYLRQRGGVWLPHDPDAMQAMAAADVLITDYSSVAEEYLIFDRPLVFADHLAHAMGRDRAHRDRGDWAGIFACGTVVTEKGALAEAISFSLEHPDAHGAARRAMRDYVFAYLDGRCAERAAEAIASLLLPTHTV